VVVDEKHLRLGAAVVATYTSRAGGQRGNDIAAGTPQKLGQTRTQKFRGLPVTRNQTLTRMLCFYNHQLS
jgi:hypothetical protein